MSMNKKRKLSEQQGAYVDARTSGNSMERSAIMAGYQDKREGQKQESGSPVGREELA